MNIVVGIADMKISNDPDVTIITHALGSCIGLVVYDPQARVGGILHYMLPESKQDTQKAQSKPFMYADTGIPLLFKSCYEFGALKQRMSIKAAGGSQMMASTEIFNIGKRNYAALRKILFRNNVLIKKEHIGGSVNRTMKLDIATGEVSLKISGQGYINL